MITDADTAANMIHTAIFGKDKNRDDVIIKIATENDINKRIEIANKYLILYSKALYEDILKKVGGDFGECAAQLFMTPLEHCIKCLERAIDKKRDFAIFEQLTPRTIEEMDLIKRAYQQDTGKDLLKDLEKIYSKDPMKTNIKDLFTTNRNINHNPDSSDCLRCASTLIDQGEKKWFEQFIFRDIFLKKSPEELVMIARYYFKNSGKSLIETVEKISDKQKKLLLREVLYNVIMPHEIATEKIYLAIKGAGTDEETLSRQLVARFGLDMHLLRDLYVYKYKITMRDDIIDDTSGSYQKICLALADS